MTPDPTLLGPTGRFLLDPAARTLRLDGQPLALGARALDVLLALVDAGGELVTKEQLLQRCWPGLVVEEANVHVQVSQLRKLLGTQAIATVPGLGYRFAWPVQRSDARAVLNNLPAPRTPLVGREALIDAASRRMADTRLLTFIGIGGTGKTRLAMALARQLLGEFADGVWWVDLAPLDHADQVAAMAAQVLGVVAQGAKDPAAALPGWLRGRRLLLVLDNCEHLLDATARLADELLAASPRVKLLVTSREALGTPGEVVFPVAPLALPMPQASEQEVLASEAVRLFADRAAAAGYALEPAQAGAAAEICRRVDGIPLALELAAAQLRVVSPSQLLELLRERFRLVTGQRRALARQQTMEEVIRWSFEHLRTDERQLLMALALCSGGCDLDAAAALMGPQMPQVALLSGLSRLAEQSLLVVQHGQGPARYHLLETVRQFAFDRSQDSEYVPLLRTRHAEHYLALAEACTEEYERSGDGSGPFARLDAERDNIMRAIDACLHGDVPDAAAMGLRLLAALRRYWLARGLGRTGAQLGLAALSLAQALPPDRTHVTVAFITAYLLWGACGRLDDAHRVALQAQQLAQASGDVAGLASAHQELGSILGRMGRHDEGHAEHETAARLALQAGERELYADVLVRLGNTAAMRGQLQQAAAYFDEALPIRLASRHAWRVVGALQYAAALALKLADADRARSLLRRAAAELPRVGRAPQYELQQLETAVALAALQGQWSVVARLGAASKALALPDAPHPRALGFDEHTVRGLLEQARTALDEETFDTANAIGQRDGLAQTLAYAAQWLNDETMPGN